MADSTLIPLDVLMGDRERAGAQISPAAASRAICGRTTTAT